MKWDMVGVLLDSNFKVVGTAMAGLDPADIRVALDCFDRIVLFRFWRGVSLGLGARAKAHSNAERNPFSNHF